MKPDLESLLSAAVEQLDAGAELERLTIGERQFRVITHEADHGWIVVLLQDPVATCEETLMNSFGMTMSQARVAKLLAERHSTREIAQKLGVQPNTIRRHTEQVLRKLGVSNRWDVRDAVLDE